MGMLAEKQSHFELVKDTIMPALQHFDCKTVTSEIKHRLLSAADIAFSDTLIFEKFEIWNAEKDDEVFLFHINRYFDNLSRKPLDLTDRDLTSKREQTEASIKAEVRNRQKKIFGERITMLALQHKLLTNEALGKFLEVSGEQARKFKAGDNKPQLTTLQSIAERFKVSVAYLVGLTDEKEAN